MIAIEKLTISERELASIDDYRRRQNTAVLTIMFTDIEGFTNLTETKGEGYSAEVRAYHDDIVSACIEKDGKGLIIKFIGDAVMAVFSEPSSAVECALAIQAAFKEFNRAQIKVRIGLHMGQVTVENKLQMDVFGRHVNRCSRIESLAQGGQIYLSYSVFDSAKGWLQQQKNLIWASHGDYYLKGIAEPVAIYEVLFADHGLAQAPKSAKKKGTFPKFVAMAGLLLTGSAVTLGLLQYQKTEVWFREFYPQEMILDGQAEIILDGDASREKRLSLTEISPGKHILHYDVSNLVRYYAEIELDRGVNYIKPRFQYMALPALNKRFTLEAGHQRQAFSAQREFEYYEYDIQGNKIKHKAAITVNAAIKVDIENAELAHYQINWTVELDGQTLSQDALRDQHLISDGNSKRSEREIVLYKDNYHYYFYRYYINRSTIDFTLQANFIRYLN